MKSVSHFKGVYLHRLPVDLRKGINGLSELVAEQNMGKLMAPYLFVFCGRKRDLMKVLYFDKSGFCLWQKRLEKDRFPWPKKLSDEVIELTAKKFEWLLDGIDVWKLKQFKELNFEKVI